MLKETITYVDFNDEERTEDFYFNLSKAELMQMELSVHGGISAKLQKIIQDKDVPALTTLFNDLLLRSYGRKSDDGRRFIKSPEASAEFAQTEAYSQLFLKLVTDDKAAAAFVNGITPVMPEDPEGVKKAKLIAEATKPKN